MHYHGSVAASFSRRLIELRRQAGFKTAYQFYHKNGGRRHFPFTYVHYLRIENAGRLPRPEWMGRIVLALRLAPDAREGRAFFLSYLEDQLGDKEACALILKPLLSAAVAPVGPAGLPKWAKAEHTIHLTPRQFKALASDRAAYWCSEVLCNDCGAWNADAAASVAGVDRRAAEKALRLLVKLGLARRTRAGLFRARFPGKLYTFPGRLDDMAADLARVRHFWDELAARRGGWTFDRVELVRAEDSFMRGYAASLAATVDASAAGAEHAKGEDTALYAVEARVRRLLPL